MNLVPFKSPSKIYDNESTRYEYQQSDIIGRGAFGCVYKGYDKVNAEFVALKIIRKTRAITFDKSIQSELEILQRIPKEGDDYKYLITYKDFYETENHFVIVMELFDNSQELLKYMERNKKINEDTALEIFRQITCGINALHSIFIAHRDIKPQNILINNQQQIKIVDFGYAKRIKQEYEFSLSIAGSPIYMSPQNLFQIGYNVYCNDIWSLGITLYQMITGKFPWNAKTGKELDEQLIKYIHQEISLKTEGLPKYIKEIVIDCLKIDENERIKSIYLKWKVQRIIEESIKESYHQEIKLPKFDWSKLQQFLPKLNQLFLKEDELVNNEIQQQDNTLDSHLKLLRQLQECHEMFHKIPEIEDYLGIFGYVLLRITKQTLNQDINITKLHYFWAQTHNMLKKAYSKLSPSEIQTQLQEIQEIEQLYAKADINTVVYWEYDKNFINNLIGFLKQPFKVSEKYQQSYQYLLTLLQQ